MFRVLYGRELKLDNCSESYMDFGKMAETKTRKLAHSKKLRVKKKFPLDFAMNSKMETLINAGDVEGDCNN
jgi:hypothetical protein